MTLAANQSSYEDLFGELDFKKGDAARSVYSPAAYLTDLIQLLYDYFEFSVGEGGDDNQLDLDFRRPDIKDIRLNGENTYDQIPYLDIVNEILKLRIESQANENIFELMKKGDFPFNLPLNFDYERLKKHLNYLNVREDQVEALFSQEVDFSKRARRYLGLSTEETTYFLLDRRADEEAVKVAYHLQAGERFNVSPAAVSAGTNDGSALAEIPRFLLATGLTGAELRDLLFQNLSTVAKDAHERPEKTMAGEFFINHGLGGYATLDDSESFIVWHPDEDVDESDFEVGVPLAWFDRADRFIRLAQKIGWTLSDLDLLLRNCCNNQLNHEALTVLAIIQQLKLKFDRPIDVLCALFSDITVLGQGDGDEPADLFNRIFNERTALIDRKYLQQSLFVHPGHSEKIGQTFTLEHDILADESKPYRRRLQKSLKMTDKDIVLIVNKFRARSAADPSFNSSLDGNLQLAGLSLLFRMTTLVELLDITPADLFDLFDLLEYDPLIRSSNPFNLLLPFQANDFNCYRIIDQPQPNRINALWLVQILTAAVPWMQQHDLSPASLKYIQTGGFPTAEGAESASEQTMALFQQVVKAFGPTGLNRESLVSELFNLRSARVIHQEIVASEPAVVAQFDPHILRFESQAAYLAAYQGIRELGTITKDDFKGLGLADRLVDKLYTNLMIHGYIGLDGEIKATKLAEFGKGEKFSCMTDFSTHREDLFGIIFDLYTAEQKKLRLANSDALDLELSLFISDLADLNVTKNQAEELYDNLIFNGYIDAEGNLLNLAFFADDDNEPLFELNTFLTEDHIDQLHQLLVGQVKRYEDAPFTLNRDIFAPLGLSNADQEGLLENLHFNDYIDESLHYLDKQSLRDLPLKEFKCALQFYPYHKEILAALKGDLQAERELHLKIQKEFLNETAEDIVAAVCFDRLRNSGDYFSEEGRLNRSGRRFFAAEENGNQLDLGHYFSPNLNQAIFNQIHLILANAQQYRVDDQQFSEMGLNRDEVEDLLFELIERDFVDLAGYIPADKTEYFLNVNNALDLRIGGYEDFVKDIFFVFHAAAKKMQVAQEELVKRLETIANSQEQAVINTLAEGLEIDSESLKTICYYLFHKPAFRVEALLNPIFTAVQLASDHSNLTPPSISRLFSRLAQFVRLANQLKLDAEDVEVVFQDQNLVEKFPENLVLAEGVTHIDALLSDLDDKIYLFNGSKYWVYSAVTYELEVRALELATLSPLFAGLSRVNATFVDPGGDAWLISGSQYFRRPKGKHIWEVAEKSWGKINNIFADPEQIQAGFTNREGVTYLFSDDQYIRYSEGNFDFVDPGFPLQIQENFPIELGSQQLPKSFNEYPDAAFEGVDGQTFLFKDSQFVQIDHHGVSNPADIANYWGQVDNNFVDLSGVDGILDHDGYIFLFLDDQVIRYSDAIENSEVTADEGFPIKISSLFRDLPDEFEYGIDGIFKGHDGKIHLFKNNRYARYSADFTTREKSGTLTSNLGKIRNNIQDKRIRSNDQPLIDAAFTGLDGCTYLFCGDQYYRYSGHNFSRVDEGYPRTIAEDWGGVEEIAAAFVLDGKTYLFAKGTSEYLCYSTNDYDIPDTGFPKPFDQAEWWNLPESLVASGFSEPDAIFIGLEQNWYLFKGEQFVFFDHLHRWWSEPQPIATQWVGFDVGKVDAAFTGKNGKTYLFAHDKFFRYSDPKYSKLDDRYPREIKSFWGKVNNQIARTRRIDSALVVESQETEINDAGVEETTVKKHTYLFSGDQYFRYTGEDYRLVDEGYPRTIQAALHEEPRFKHVKNPIKARIDAAFADQRHIYLVQGSIVHVIANEAYRRYETSESEPVTAAFIDEGSVFVKGESGWSRSNHLEMDVQRLEAEIPPILRVVPAEFQSDLNAVLAGTDGNTYLFRSGICYNRFLQRSYPTREEWGIVHNRITLDSHIDAAFLGQDGRIYLFSGDQFVQYEPDAIHDIMAKDHHIDGLPRRIADQWGGLTHVHLAFVQKGKTYLMEKPDEFGEFRYVCYSTADYSKPDDDAVQTAGFDWWGVPTIYQDEGFGRVDAVLNDEHNLFLIQGQEFIQYNEENDVWTYAKPLSRVWRGLHFNETNFQAITTAFKHQNGQVYFFAREHFEVVPHDIELTAPFVQAAPILKIRNHWGLVKNPFTSSGRVDAAFTWDGRETYLFSGGWYVKYSTSDYRFVDDGYPKTIADHLRQEEIFRELPVDFDDDMRAEAERGAEIAAVVANKGTIYIFLNQAVYAVSPERHRSCTTANLGHIKNRILQRRKVDAAVAIKREQGDQVLLFSGDQVFRYDESNFSQVAEGFPQKISRVIGDGEAFDGLDPEFAYDLDAVLKGPDDGLLYLIKGKMYVASSEPAVKKPVNGLWGKIRNNFEPAGPEENIALDGAFIAPDGQTYLFKGNQYMRSADFDAEYADVGYPLPIKDNWGNLPDAYESGLDGAFVFEGNTYLITRGEEGSHSHYVRYSGLNYQMVDPIYPQLIIDRWRKWGDYLLADMRLISLFKQMQQETSGRDVTLTELLNGKTGGQETPFDALHLMFGWDISEIKWIKRNHAFLPAPNQFDNRFNLEIIAKMGQIFEVADQIGVDPSTLYEEIWQNLYSPSNNGADGSEALRIAADHLYRYLGNKYGEKDWEILKQKIHNELNILKRDVWVPMAIAGDPSLKRPKDLYDLLLIDVEMGSEAQTSKVKEAISAIQLYFHRFLVHLEQVQLSTTPSNGGPITRAQIKKRWQWLKNYRLWEANRKVFLYPENYIRPELRDTKTPEFQKLEETLLQGELNSATAEAAFTSYLESFGQVSTLKIAGANVYYNGLEKELILIGHTRLAPRQFYYRTARFMSYPEPDRESDPEAWAEWEKKDDLVVWSSWAEIDTTIKSERVFPIRSHGRLMIFWIEIEDIEEPAAKFKSKGSGDETLSEVQTSQSKLRHEATVKYSLLKYNDHWSPPQPLKQGVRLDYEIDAAYSEGNEIVTFAGRYCLKSSDENPNADVRRIETVPEFRNLPDSFKSGVDAATIFNGKRYLFKGNRVIIQNTGPSPDILVEKSLGALIDSPKKAPIYVIAPGIFHVGMVPRDEVQDNPVLANGIDAAFDFGGGVLTLVDKKGNYSFYTEAPGHHIKPLQDLNAITFFIPHFWILIATLVNRDGQFRPADAIFKKDEIISGSEQSGTAVKDSIFYVLRDGQYECYDDVGTELVALDGFPKPIRGNLTFNMDKFYNKLHIENTAEQIYISYTSPKNEIMVYGRLKPDYTFDDIPINDVPALKMINSWPAFWSSNQQAYRGLFSQEEINTPINSLSADLTAIQRKIRAVQAIESGRDLLGQALDLARELRAADESNDEESEDIIAELQQGIRDIAEQIRQTNKSIPGPRFVRKSRDILKERIESLVKTTDRVGRGSNQQRKRIREAVDRDLAAGADGIAAINQNLQNREITISNQIQGLSDGINNLMAHTVLPDNRRHADNGRAFDKFLEKIRPLATTWRKRLDSSETDEVDAIDAAETNALTPYRNQIDQVNTLLQSTKDKLGDLKAADSLSSKANQLGELSGLLQALSDAVRDRNLLLDQADASEPSVNQAHRDLLSLISQLKRAAEEAVLGAFDLFPTETFGISTMSNFAFSEQDQPDWYCFEAQDGTFLARPLTDEEGGVYEIIRLTTSVVPILSGLLFAQGIEGFLSLNTQGTDETPRFREVAVAPDDDPSREAVKVVVYKKDRFAKAFSDRTTREYIPVNDHLDFQGASGIYYEELFFHAPFLIAQALNAAQKFEEAKWWYEVIFDPTAIGSVWQYFPFTLTGVDDQDSQPTTVSEVLEDPNQIVRYLDDPFDPHAIAALRPAAYRKAIVMRYIDNLIDWGDMLFRQYTIESINEARMLYILGRDLLGDKPENLGTLILPEEKSVIDLANTDEYDFVVYPALTQPDNSLIGREPISIIAGTPHDSVGQRYFFVPENTLFSDYWGRIEDRLFKIRNSLNFEGQAVPPLLFQPPIDPMALVQAVASGVSLSRLMAGAAVKVPHYRFEFLAFRAQNLVQKLNQYGSELLATLEKKDAEELSLMQNRQEGHILKMMINIREAQIKEVDQTILNLQESQAHAKERIQLYSGWLSSGMLPEEIHQINLMIAASTAHFAGSVLKLGAMIASLAPNAMIGPFIMGTQIGGSNIGDSLSSGAEIAESLGEGLSVTGEILAAQAQFKHMVEDWEVQLMVAESEDRQIEYQLEGARLQKMIAEYELAVLQKEIEQNQSIHHFMKDKFTNVQLYQWMIGKMSGLYYQTYQMAFDMARMAERAFHFERGLPEADGKFISGGYWDSQHQGLMAGESLALDLDRMEQAFIETNERRLEISTEISLLDLNPLAFLQLKVNGSCEFYLDEAFFDYDFPGHYCRQIKTIAVDFDTPDGVTINATLTQLSHQTVLHADAKAVKYLLDPKDQPPTTIRGSWRGNQQIVLSHHDEYEKNNGLFELRYDTDRYLPFEGTGAVSRWKLELNGKKGSVNLSELVDVTIGLKYTAKNGGSVFAAAVKGLLRPYAAVRFFDMTFDFAQQWNDFLDGDDSELVLPFTRDLFPNMSSSKISGIFTHFDLVEPGRATMVLNGVEQWTLGDYRFTETNGLSIGSKGSNLTFEFRGSKENLRNIQFVFTYKAAVG